MRWLRFRGIAEGDERVAVALASVGAGVLLISRR